MSVSVRKGELPKRTLDEWNKWNCLNVGTSLVAFIVDGDETSCELERLVLNEILPHFAGTGLITIAYRCNGSEQVIKDHFSGHESKCLILKDGVIEMTFGADADADTVVNALQGLL